MTNLKANKIMKKLVLAGCAIVENDKILLLHRIKRDCYELPGGKVDEGELPEQAAVREIREELLCEVTIIRKLGEKTFKEDGHEMEYIWYLAQTKDEQQPRIGEPDKFDDLRQIPLNQLDKYKLSANMQNFVEQLNKKNILL